MERDNTIDINQYTKKKHIGSGNFGNVYTVLDNKTNKILAAKIFKEEINKSKDKTTLKNLKREVSIISRVQHPSIIQFIGLSMKDFDNNDRPVIITNYIPNGSLKNLLDLSEKSCASKKYNDTKKLITIYGIAASMQFLHSHQILHRDLKPENILMDDSYYPILADFGISKDQNILEKSFAGIKGTPLYLSPEIWEDFYYSKASDVYAFSLIVFEIIANEKPFKNCKNIFTLQQQVINGNRPDTSYIDEPYKNLIESCWAQDFEYRPTFEDIVQELKENPGFITDSIDEDEFKSYIKYIDESPKDFISIINPKYKKNIDIVYLIDGSKSNEVLLTAVNDTFESISFFCKKKFPSIYFRFGFVIYYDLIFTQKAHITKKRYPVLLDLTDDFEDIKNFLLKSKADGNGGEYPNDLASGFNAIYDRISWEKNSEKVIIHICNSPAFGKYFTMDQNKNSNDKKNEKPFIKTPFFKKNVKYKINFDIFQEVQEKQNNWLIVNIRRLAKNGIKMYCLNTNKLAIYSCNEVSQTFIKVGGKKFVIQNLFDQNLNSDMFDIDELNADFEQFVKNVVDSSTKSDAETPFEIECKKQFDKDFSEFFDKKSNKKQVDELMLRIAELEKQVSIDKEEIKKFKKEKKAFQNQIQELEDEKRNIEQNELLKDRSLNIKINTIKKENAELSKKLEKIENENMKLMDEVEIKNREFQIQRQKWLKERSVLDTKYNELLASYKEEKNKQITRTSPPQLPINTDQLINENKNLKNENQKLSDANKSLIKKYNDLYSKNHHNYVLIGDMKKLIIEMGNLDQSETKLGGIDMIKVAFAKKNKIINDLKKK